MDYLVEWHINIEAESPEQAANLARVIQLDPDNQANHFYVTAEEDDGPVEINADLEPVQVRS